MAASIAALGLSVLVHMPQEGIAIGIASAGSTLFRRAAQAAMGLGCEVFQKQVALPFGKPCVTIYTRRPDLRIYRNITVIDGRICKCGSQNYTDPEFRTKSDGRSWIDIMLRFERPVAR